jgi:hypothetical protein
VLLCLGRMATWCGIFAALRHSALASRRPVARASARALPWLQVPPGLLGDFCGVGSWSCRSGGVEAGVVSSGSNYLAGGYKRNRVAPDPQVTETFPAPGGRRETSSQETPLCGFQLSKV